MSEQQPPMFDAHELRDLGLALRGQVRLKTRGLALTTRIAEREAGAPPEHASPYFNADAVSAARADLARWRAFERKVWVLAYSLPGAKPEEIADRLIADFDAADADAIAREIR